MKLTPSNIEDVVLQIFLDRRLTADEEIRLVRLEEFWKQTGLRRPDLLHAVVRLAATGLIRLSEEGGDTYLALTAEGEARGLQQVSGEAPAWRSWLTDEVLPALRHRTDNEIPKGKRRGSDQSVVTGMPAPNGRKRR